MRLVTATLIVAAMIAPTGASAERFFDGALTYTALSHCTNTDGIFPRTSQFYPRLVGGNKNRTALSEFDQKSAASYNLPPGVDFTSAFKNVSEVSIWGGWSTSAAQIRIISQVPATITATTPFLTLIGQIQNPGNDPGCVATFKASYVGRNW